MRLSLRVCIVAIVVSVAIGLLYTETRLIVRGIEMYERTRVYMNQSADLAYGYGNKHLDDAGSLLYDINAADEFYATALALDPAHPYAYHQRARIAFLRGHFTEALALIDYQIGLHQEKTIASFYIRGLILGFMGRYEESAESYEIYLQSDPTNWAAINDYAWALLKSGRADGAAAALARGLEHFPDNPWLLNTYATALYELGDYNGAHDAVVVAAARIEGITEADWLTAYPGNDPQIASEGVAAFKRAIEENMHTIEAVYASSTLKSRQ